jgi:hypothetical protein
MPLDNAFWAAVQASGNCADAGSGSPDDSFNAKLGGFR